eukprot:scaffold29328_cov57-Attheya_sp.AAC.2
MLRRPVVGALLRRNTTVAASRRQQPSRQGVKEYRSSSTSAASDEELDYLIRLQNARLGFPSSSSSIQKQAPSIDLTVYPATAGGHAVLGPNGSGKSLLSNALVELVTRQPLSHFRNHGDTNNNYGISSSASAESLVEQHESMHKRSVSRVSFESHEALLALDGTVYAALTPLGGQLGKAAQFLCVRFGLFPLLGRFCATLSTGEIRKVLLVRALVTRPQLLILDNAFDGLDVAARESLKDLVSKTLNGFRSDILVQSVSSKDTAHTQVLLLTQRPEEIVDQISTVSSFVGPHHRHGHLEDHQLFSTQPRNGRSGIQLLHSALHQNDNDEDQNTNKSDLDDDLSLDWNRNDVALPSLDEIRAVWQSGGEDKRTHKHHASRENKFISTLGPVVEATQLKVQRGDAILMDGFDWKVMEGDRWLLAGGNGSCKSTLSRLLTAQDENAVSGGHLQTPQSVGWVSTELHMSLTQSTLTGRDILLGHATPTASQTMTRHHSPHVADAVASWLELGTIEAAFLDRPFQNLSQGEQKIVLIGAALAGRPEVLVLDEPCQGLDLWNRRLVLKLVEQLCRATRTTLIYITHHLEEVIPSVTHVLHLHKGSAIYNGPRSNYDPTRLDETTR